MVYHPTFRGPYGHGTAPSVIRLSDAGYTFWLLTLLTGKLIALKSAFLPLAHVHTHT